jgi:hypothetical protein
VGSRFGADSHPRGIGAGLWLSGTGLTADEHGLLYMMTGNGNTAPGTPDLTNSFVQLRHDAVASRLLVAGTFRLSEHRV